MARTESLYPPSPADVPAELTMPSEGYRTHAILVLIGLFCFFVLYLGLIVLCVWMVTFGLFVPIYGKLILCPFCALLLLYLIKGFFKKKQVEKALMIEIHEEDHPCLFEFIARLCDETGAPFPHKVFVTPEVNAAVFYNQSIFSLFLPVPKNLLIGMGLVNVLNLSEFKAVLAHEFGHFAQSSMKLGTYVYVINRIIRDIVFGRDWLDDLVDRIRHENSHLFLIGLPCYGLIWVFRQIMTGCYYAINFLDLSLSREMEFNADRMAVSVAGSDAIVNALARLEFANECLSQALGDLTTAADHELYTTDLFLHQTQAAPYLRLVRKKPNLGIPPPLPDDPELSPEVFEPDDERKPEMWATHPKKYDREESAKDYYIRCPIDERSPWLLFDKGAELREAVTWRFYKKAFRLRNLPGIVLTEAAYVQSFIDEEHAETNYDSKYEGLYDGRFIEPGDLELNRRFVREWPCRGDVIKRVTEHLYGEDFVEKARVHKKLREDVELLRAVQNGNFERDAELFLFRGKKYKLRAADRLLDQLADEIAEDKAWVAELDSWAFKIHYQMALEVSGARASELVARYEFHLELQKLGRKLLEQDEPLNRVTNFLSNARGAIQTDTFLEVIDIFRKAHQALNKSLIAARELKIPALKNMKEGQVLGEFLLTRDLVKEFRPVVYSLKVKWVQKFLKQMVEVKERVRRLHFKSMGAILALQEKITKEWRAAPTYRPVLQKTQAPAPVHKSTPQPAPELGHDDWALRGRQQKL